MAGRQHGIEAAAASGRERVWLRSFHVWIAVSFVLVTFAGFTPTYLEPIAAGRFHANPVVHIHAMVFFGWTLLFLVQTVLVAIGQTWRHRDLGLLGVSLATAMSILGPLATLNSLKTAYASGTGGLAEVFSIVPITAFGAFAIIAVLAFTNVRRPEVHRRLLVLSIIVVIDAPIARLTRPLMSYLYGIARSSALPLWAGQLLSFALADIFLIAGLVYDWRTRGRPHVVNLVGGGAVVVMQCLRQPISQTATWHNVVHGFLALSGTFPSPH